MKIEKVINLRST